MDSEYVIEVDHVSKHFKVYFDKGSQLKEKVLSWKRNRYEERPVLDDVSFYVEKGQAIGLVGHNGCGKSTTLKLLSQIMYPDSGTVTMHGRVVALIELGAGFHPDMSGRENIYTNAAIFGLSHKEIDEKIDDIIAFSEIEDFIDNPVRTYSSGMYMRLAFSVAINVDADILLIDEILAVGDAAFQAKCFNRLKQIKSEGTTIVIVSHALNQIEEICDRSIWIHEGRIRADGTPSEVHPQYLDYVEEYRMDMAAREEIRKLEKQQAKEAERNGASFSEEVSETTDSETLQNQDADESEISLEELEEQRKGTGEVIITNVEMYDNKDRRQTIFRVGDDIRIKISYHVNKKVEHPAIAYCIMRYGSGLMYATNTQADGLEIEALDQDGVIWLNMPSVQLLPESYSMDIAVLDSSRNNIDYKAQVCTFEMISKQQDAGLSRVVHEWVLPK